MNYHYHGTGLIVTIILIYIAATLDNIEDLYRCQVHELHCDETLDGDNWIPPW